MPLGTVGANKYARVMYAAAHSLIVASGSMPGGEVWACGLRTDVPTPDQGAQTVVDSCYDAWATLVGSATALFSTGVSLERVQLRRIGTDGKTTSLFEAANKQTAVGIGTVKLPPQCAVVLSLMTAKAGRSGKGRIYLPLLGTNIGPDGRIASGGTGGVAGPGARLLTDINSALAANQSGIPRVAVQSQAAGGGSSEVLAVRVGDVVDTQRRRRDALVENYVTVAVAG